MAEENNSYVVSARKYRPATFESVVGQKHITSTLQNAIKNNQLAQVFLFCGPRGVGKTTCARILAKTINCTNVTENIEACDECESCKSFNNASSLNIVELDAASNNSVDDIRELVHQINVPPMNGKYKVYIIDEVHMLSQSAFNAFLKTLEEPPKYVKFILATTEKHKILGTILSRCQIFDFHRITVNDISSHLEYIAKQENVKYEKAALDIIASKSDGALRDALSMFDLMVSFTNANLTYDAVISSLNILDYDYFFKFVDNILGGDISNTLLLFNDVLSKGFQGDIFTEGLSSHIRNLLVCKDSRTVQLLDVPSSIQERYLEQSQKTPTLFLLKCLDFANKTAQEYRLSNNKRLCIELMLLKMCNVMNKMAEKKKPNSEVKATVSSTQIQEKVPIVQVPAEKKEDPKPKIQAKEDKTEPTEKEKTVTRLLGGRFSTPFSIKEGSNADIPRPIDEIEEKPFDFNDVIHYIDAYCSSISDDKEKSNLFFALSNAKKISNKDFILELVVKSSMDEQTLARYKTDLTQSVKKRLSYKFFKIEIRVETQQKQEVIYDRMDKYFVIIKKNPAIEKLKETFDAEIQW